jgi:hypothetical protein
MLVMLTAVTVIAGLAIPAAAGAATASSADPAAPALVKVVAAPSTAKSRATEQLKLKIAEVLRVRAASFGSTTGSLAERIDSLNLIANRLEKAGGNVKRARKQIAAAKRHISKARILERQTVASFNSVVSANNRTAAFAAARKKGKLATTQLKLAQADVRAATTELRAVVKRLNAH